MVAQAAAAPVSYKIAAARPAIIAGQTLAFSRILYRSEILAAYNVDGNDRHDSLIVDADLRADGSSMKFLYGGIGTVPVRTAKDGSRYVKLDLAPHQFVILG